MREGISDEARDLILKLLERDPQKRLGSGTKGAENIKSHPFFKELDWSKLSKREL